MLAIGQGCEPRCRCDRRALAALDRRELRLWRPGGGQSGAGRVAIERSVTSAGCLGMAWWPITTNGGRAPGSDGGADVPVYRDDGVRDERARPRGQVDRD